VATQSEDYKNKKGKAIEKVAATLEECLSDFSEEEQANIREDIANYMVGYLGVSFGLHVKRR
jgi:hypothetical protein